MGWFVVGSYNGFICVYNYKNKMQKITSFKVTGKSTLGSLAIHPTRPYVLSASISSEIKLWDWNQGWFGWKCIRRFEENPGFLCKVAFNPKDHNGFATGSLSGTIKVLLSFFFL
jgi:coatomer subunit beta'